MVEGGNSEGFEQMILRRFPSDYGWGTEGIVRIGRESDIAALVIHGMADEVIPFSHGQAVFRQISSKYKRFVPVDGAGHCDFQIVLGEKYVPLLRDFILKKDYNVGAKRTVGWILNWFGYSGKMD